MKKYFFILITLLVLIFSLTGLTYAANEGIVSCGNDGQPRCELSDIFALIEKSFNFIVFDIATPLAGLLIVIGGVYITISAGNSGMVSKGKQMIIWSIVAWVLIFSSYLIIKTVLSIFGIADVPSIPASNP